MGKGIIIGIISVVIILLILTGVFLLIIFKDNSSSSLDERNFQQDDTFVSQNLPSCGNNQCENFGGINELTSCQADCNFNTPIKTPICGNGKCEVFGGVDEFVSCGFGTVNDCGVQCNPEECWIDYCSQGCSEGSLINSNPQPVEDSKNYKIKVYYVYNSGEKDNLIINKISSTIGKTSQLFKNYNGMSITPIIEQVEISYNIGDGHDVYYPHSERLSIWSSINKKVNLESDVSNFDGIWIVLAGTKGGAFSVDYKSPIYFDGEHFSRDSNGILTAHEFLHNFGCKDINGGKSGVIMGDLKVTTLSDSTLGECGQFLRQDNYGSHTIQEYLGSGTLQSIFGGTDRENVITK